MALLHTGATCSAECYEPESDDAAPAALHAAASPATWQRPARQHGGCVAPFNLCMHEHISLIMLPEHLQIRMVEAWSSQSGLPAAAVRTASHAGSSVVSHMQSSAPQSRQAVWRPCWPLLVTGIATVLQACRMHCVSTSSSSRWLGRSSAHLQDPLLPPHRALVTMLRSPPPPLHTLACPRIPLQPSHTPPTLSADPSDEVPPLLAAVILCKCPILPARAWRL